MNGDGRMLRSLMLAALLVAPAPALGQRAGGPAGVAAAPESEATASRTPADTTGAAALVYEGDTIAVFRVANMGVTPLRRAEIARQRLDALRPEQLAHDVRLQPIENGYTVLLGDSYLFFLLDADLDPHERRTPAQVAENAQLMLTHALASRARLLSPESRWRSVLWSVVATVALIALIRVLIWGRRRLVDWVRAQSDARRGRKLGDVVITSVSAGSAWLAGMLTHIGIIVLVFLWAISVLNRFPETRPFGAAARQAVFGWWSTFQLEALRAIPGLIGIVLIVLACRFAGRLATDIFNGIERGNIRIPGIHPETADATRRLVIAMIWLLAIVVAYPLVPGSDSDAFKGVSVFLGLIVTLGSSGVVGHLMSGLVLVYSRALREGDFVRVADIEGTVLEVGALSVKIANARKEEFTIPNAVMVGSVVKNFTRLSRDSGAPLTTSVTIGYDAPWRVVHEMLLTAAERTPGLRKQPPPVVMQASLSNFYVEYQLIVRLERPDPLQRAVSLNTLHQNIQDVFNERGIQIMSPAFESQPEKSVLVPKEKWFQAPGDPPKTGPAPGSGAPVP